MTELFHEIKDAAVNPPEGYYRLNVGEIVQPGDLLLRDGKWWPAQQFGYDIHAWAVPYARPRPNKAIHTEALTWR